MFRHFLIIISAVCLFFLSTHTASAQATGTVHLVAMTCPFDTPSLVVQDQQHNFPSGDMSGCVNIAAEVTLTDANGQATPLTTDAPATLAEGTYTVTDAVSGLSTPIIVTPGQISTAMTVRVSSEPAALVHGISLQCGTEATLSIAMPETDCPPVAGTLSFYLYGDNSDRVVAQLPIDPGMVDAQIWLNPGTYAVVAEESGLQMDLTVESGGEYTVIMTVPAAEVPAPEPTEAPTGPQATVSALPSTGTGHSMSSNAGILMTLGTIILTTLGFLTQRLIQHR